MNFFEFNEQAHTDNNILKGINLFEVLGLESNASSKEIKKAYRKKARKLHPDKRKHGLSSKKHAQLDEEMTMINAVYAILSDPIKRRKYQGTHSASFDELKGYYAKAQELDKYFRSGKINKQEYNTEWEKSFPEGSDAVCNYNNNLATVSAGEFQAAFNSEFDRTRTEDPNDIGYGEYGEELAPRTDESVGTSYNVAVKKSKLKKPKKLFDPKKKKKFDLDRFNYTFEKQKENSGKECRELVTVGDEPLGVDGSSALSYASEVSSFGGLLIVGSNPDQGFSKDTSSLTKYKGSDSLGYADYQDSFNGADNPDYSDNEPEEIIADYRQHQHEETRKWKESEFKERTMKVSDSRSEQIAPKESEEQYYRKKYKKMKKEKKKQKKFVEKYSQQFKPALVQKAFGGLLEASEDKNDYSIFFGN